MSTPLYIGASSGVDVASPFSVTASLPSGTRVGDLGVLFVGNSSNEPNPTPSGWSLGPQTSIGSGGYHGHVSGFVKFLDSSDRSTGSITYTHSTTSSSLCVALLVIRHGVYAAGDSHNNGDTASSSQVAEAIGTAATDGFHLACAYSSEKDTVGTAGSYTPPTGFTEVADLDAEKSGSINESGQMAVAYKALTAGTVTSTATFTCSQSNQYGTAVMRIEYDPSNNSGLQMVI